jgi:hypothetical protein
MATKQKTHTHVYGVFRNRADAERVYDALVLKGYTDREIHVMMTEDTRRRYYPHDEKSTSQHPVGSQATEGMGVGAATGGILGAAGGAIAAVLGAVGASVVIPGGFIVAGPLAAAIAGAGAGGVAGGLVGALVGFGIPESNASAYEAALTEGGIALGVEPRNKNEVDEVEQLMEDNNGENVWHTS